MFIYLQADPKISMNRIKNRGREEEKNISFEYLETLSKNHDEWLINLDNSITINYENDFSSKENIFFDSYFNLISEFIKKEIEIN